jgi:hypothetical protein
LQKHDALPYLGQSQVLLSIVAWIYVM